MKICECELSHTFAEYEFLPLGIAPICGEFEQAPDGDLEDCCVYCRHGERCHLEE